METERERERANQMAKGHLAQEKGGTMKCLQQVQTHQRPFKISHAAWDSVSFRFWSIHVYRVRSYTHLLIDYSLFHDHGIMAHWLQEDCPSNVSIIEGRRNIGRSPSAQKRRANTALDWSMISDSLKKMRWKASHKYHCTNAQKSGNVSKLRTHVSTPPLFERFNEVLVRKRWKGLTAYVVQLWSAMHIDPIDLGSWSSQLGSTIQWSKQA